MAGANAAPTSEQAVSGVKRIQHLIEQIEAIEDPSARQLMQECIQAMLELYGDGLARIMDQLGRTARNARDSLAEDDVVRALLFVHGLHPVPVEERLAGALETVRPYMESHGGNIEVVRIDAGIAVLRLEGHCKSCPSSTVTMELAVRQSIEEACPDLDGIEVEGVTAISDLEHVPHQAPEWIPLPDASRVSAGGMAATHAAETPIVLCRVGSQYYAYRDHCPACNMPLHLGVLNGSVLCCSLGHSYEVTRAGRPMGSTAGHLQPLPLLTREGVIKVALPRDSTPIPISP